VIDRQGDFLLPEGYAAQAGLNLAPLVATIRPIEKLLAVGRAARRTSIWFVSFAWFAERN